MRFVGALYTILSFKINKSESVLTLYACICNFKELKYALPAAKTVIFSLFPFHF